MEDRDIYLEALNDHYKETFSYQREYLKQRDSLFTYVLFVFAGMFILMTGADFAYSALANVTNEKLGVIIEINSRVIDTLLWFVLFSIVVKYYQISIVIERQYVYLKLIEAELNGIINKNYIFQREGNTYADYYKIFPRTNRSTCY